MDKCYNAVRQQRLTARCDMTTYSSNTVAKMPQSPGRFVLPDIPQRDPDEVTQFNELTRTGHAHHLIQHLGNLDTTLVSADRWMIVEPGTFRELARYPDLLVAFGVDPELYEASNGYIISEQGKPPDFVLEVASASTGNVDTGPKRQDYARMGIPEYWRFDQTGEHHGERLAGDRLVGGVYQPMPIDELADGALEGYSPALNLLLRWDAGSLAWHDPETGQHIATFTGERARADAEAEARRQAEARAGIAEARAGIAEARVSELEAELRRLRDG